MYQINPYQQPPKYDANPLQKAICNGNATDSDNCKKAPCKFKLHPNCNMRKTFCNRFAMKDNSLELQCRKKY